MTTSSTSNLSSAADLEPLSPPRLATPLSRRRAWTEPSVRFWWLASLIFLASAGYFAIAQYQLLSSERRLLREGVVVDALVRTADGEPVPDKTRPKDSICELSYEFNGASHTVVGRLEGRKEWIKVGSKVPLHIDPNNPEVWTGRTEVGTSSLNDWIAPLIIVPVALVVLLVAWVKRNRLTRLWRLGEAVPAVALNSRQTALAPRSRAVRLTPINSDDPRVYTVFIPRVAPVSEGDRVWILISPDGRGPVAAASWFQ